MYILKILLNSFLFPPGIFIVLIIGYSCWCMARQRYLCGVLWFSLGIAAWGLSTVPVADALLRPLEKGLSIPADPTGDVIVVLCAGTNNERPDPLGRGGPSERTLARLVVGARLHRSLGLPVLASGRGNGFDQRAATRIVKRYMMDLGVPADRIIVENRSRNTAENAASSAKLCRAEGFKKPILVTSASHLKRAKGYFNSEGLDVLMFPSSFETWDGKRYTWKSFLPGTYSRASMALHEYLGLVYYRLTFR